MLIHCDVMSQHFALRTNLKNIVNNIIIVDYLVTLLTNNGDNNNNNNNKVKLARIKKWFLYRHKFAHQNQTTDLFPGETCLDQAEAFLKKR